MKELYVKSWKNTYKGNNTRKILDAKTIEKFNKRWKVYIIKENNGIFRVFENNTFVGFGAFTPDKEMCRIFFI